MGIKLPPPGCRNCLQYLQDRTQLFGTVLCVLLVIGLDTFAVARPMTPPGSQPGSLSIVDFGAKCDGATDDTVAIQAAINAARNAATGSSIVIPNGRAGCVVSQLDITNSLARIRLIGEASMNGAQSYILCRERLPDVGVCVDFSGTDSFNVENLQIIGGASAATAPKVAVLLGKTRKNDGTIANGSEISWFSVTVKTHGAYGVYNYGGEIWNCHQCYFTGDGVADVVLSDANSAAIVSPFANLVAAPTSMTSVHFNGGTFGTSGSAVGVQLDPWPTSGAAPISDIGLSDGYSHIDGPAFIADTGSPGGHGMIQGIRITGWRSETYSSPATFAQFNNVVTQITIDATYATAHPTVPPLQFHGAWGPYSVMVGDIQLRPGDWSGAYPSTVVYCYLGTTGVVIHDFVGLNGKPTHNNCAGAHEM